MTSFLLEFSMFPTSADGRDGASVSKSVSKVIDMIDKSGVNYKLTPMGTIIETSTIKEALEIVEKAYDVLSEYERVYSSLKFDIRKGKKNRLKTKVASVEAKLQREIKQ